MLESTRKGTRAEYMANYVLSHLGFTVPVPRQEDFGIDFFCSLGATFGNRVFRANPFVVQCKSGDIRKLEFGGKTKGGNWKENELDYLFSLRTPLVLIHVDRESQRVLFYPMSVFRFVQKEYPRSSKIVFKYSIDKGVSTHHGLKSEDIREMDNWREEDGDGKSYKFNLQHPLIDIRIQQVNDNSIMERSRQILAHYIEIEHRNIIQHQLKWPTFNWPYKYETNNPEVEYKWIHFTEEPEISDHEKILEQNGQLINALAISLSLHKKEEALIGLKKVLKELPEYHKFPELDKIFDLYGS